MQGLTLRNLLGDNFLSRAPAGTSFDMVNGVLELPGPSFARFVRAQHSRLWHAVDSMDEHPRALMAN